MNFDTSFMIPKCMIQYDVMWYQCNVRDTTLYHIIISAKKVRIHVQETIYCFSLPPAMFHQFVRSKEPNYDHDVKLSFVTYLDFERSTTVLCSKTLIFGVLNSCGQKLDAMSAEWMGVWYTCNSISHTQSKFRYTVTGDVRPKSHKVSIKAKHHLCSTSLTVSSACPKR